MRWRQRVSDERSNTSRCWKNSSPQKYWKYGFSTGVISTGARSKVFVASSPPKPAPRITTLGFGFGMVLPKANTIPGTSLRLNADQHEDRIAAVDTLRSEERRVGKEVRTGVVAYE